MAAPNTSVDADLCTQVARLTDAILAQTSGAIKTVTNAADTAPTLTEAQVYGGIVVGTPTANRAYTLPSAATLLAQLPAVRQVVGAEVFLRIRNEAATTYTITLTASADITNAATGIAGDLVVSAASYKDYRIVFDSVTAGAVTAKIY